MIDYVEGDIFTSGCNAMVNPVNCLGIMGAGLALQVKIHFPEVFRGYQIHCRDKLLQPGGVLACATKIATPRIIYNFATKDDLAPSQLRWIKPGVKELVRQAKLDKVSSVAVPALGSGLGGLRYSEVLPILEEVFETAPAVLWLLYKPR